jgi:hypothetical protein
MSAPGAASTDGDLQGLGPRAVNEAAGVIPAGDIKLTPMTVKFGQPPVEFGVVRVEVPSRKYPPGLYIGRIRVDGNPALVELYLSGSVPA